MNYCRYCGVKLLTTEISYSRKKESCSYCNQDLRDIDIEKIGNGYLVRTKV